MISYKEALQNVLETTLDLGNESISLASSVGQILAEDIKADRDFPPFNRSTKDGIALNFEAIKKGITQFNIETVASAGMPQQTLSSHTNCIEIMTGAVLPKNADTIVMYEQLLINGDSVSLETTPKKGQNIHVQGSDERKGNILIPQGKKISPAVIGVLASVGKSSVLVKKLPRIAVVSTGNELVEVSESPLPHQIRKSNVLSVQAALNNVGISPVLLHLLDDKNVIKKELKKALEAFDVLMLSGGVSKGKFDYLPEVLESLGVEKIFHRVAQRPGKPFWFGVQKQAQKVVFSFPGNPVSTFANYHVYFLPWLAKSMGVAVANKTVILEEPIKANASLTLFVQVTTEWREGKLYAKPILGNGSGDLVSLAKADGFVCIPSNDDEVVTGAVLPFITTVTN